MTHERRHLQLPARGNLAALLPEVVQEASLLVVAVDDRGNLLAWNRACEEASGYTRDQVLGQGGGLDCTGALLDALLGDDTVELPLDGLRGRRIISWTPMGPRLPVPGWAAWGVGVDVTDMRRAERELRESEERWRSLVESCPVGIAVHNDGVIRFANPAVLRMLGAKDLSEVVGRPLLDFVHPDFHEVVKGRVREVLEGGGAVEAKEEIFLRLDGEPFHVEILGSRIRWDGRPASQVVLTEITERRRAEEERGRLEEQLRHAQKMESVGRLAGGVAHDFNNILTIIHGYLELIGHRLGPDHPVRGEVDEVLRAAERGAELTGQLLAFSRRQPASPRVVDPVQVVEDSQRLLQRLLGEGIQLRLVAPEGRWRVRVDPGQVEQVLVNLVANARDAMPTGGDVVLRLGPRTVGEGHPEVEPGTYVCLTLRDTGVGMDAATVERIFEPFFTTKEQGTGLGLATVYGIVRQNGGFIEVDSAPGEGTTLHVHLPACDAEAECAEVPRTAPRSGGGTILVVEDEPVVRRLTKTVLERAGYEVIVATGGEEAVRRHGDPSTGPVDLLLTDVVMPGMNGRELYEAMAARRPDLRVLFMSGYTADIIANHGLKDGGARFLHKPFSLDELLHRVGQLLRQTEPSRD